MDETTTHRLQKGAVEITPDFFQIDALAPARNLFAISASFFSKLLNFGFKKFFAKF
jgi:hypothetical protein